MNRYDVFQLKLVLESIDELSMYLLLLLYYDKPPHVGNIISKSEEIFYRHTLFETLYFDRFCLLLNGVCRIIA